MGPIGWQADHVGSGERRGWGGAPHELVRREQVRLMVELVRMVALRRWRSELVHTRAVRQDVLDRVRLLHAEGRDVRVSRKLFAGDADARPIRELALDDSYRLRQAHRRLRSHGDIPWLGESCWRNV